MIISLPVRLVAALIACAAVAACSDPAPEQSNVTTELDPVVNETEIIPETETAPEAPPPASETNVAEPEEPAPEPDEQAQMLDDADAVGMTARVARDAGESADNAGTPTE